MLRYFFLCLIICSSMFSIAQRSYSTPPDYNAMRRVIFEKKSDCYYPKLLNRFLSNDTTMTAEQVRYLYYGYTLQKEYKPYYHNENDSLLASYAKKVNKTVADGDTIIRLAKQSLATFPLDFYKLNQLASAYHLVGKNDLARLYSLKARQIASAIFSTGDGRSQVTAWHVISVSDEYEIVYLLGLFPIDQRFVFSNCDFISVAKNKLGVKGFFFNIKRLLDVNGDASPTK
jgi:hypothetical protein